MRRDALIDHLKGGGLAEKTIYMRANALARVEKTEGIDLDDQFSHDGMISLLEKFTYGTSDEAANRPNPTSMNIGEGSLRTVLGWYKSHLNQYRKFCLSEGDVQVEPVDDADGQGTDDAGPSSTFGLEADLQSALREHIGQLEKGLRIIDGGIERKVASGFMDILAEDSHGTPVVVELKAGTARDAVVAQVLGYMGDIAEETGKPVRGMIVAADFRPRVRSAARAIPNLDLKSYSYRFEFA